MLARLDQPSMRFDRHDNEGMNGLAVVSSGGDDLPFALSK